MSLEFDLHGIDGDQFRRLMEVLSRSDVEECEIEEGEHRLWIRRHVRQTPTSDCTTNGQSSNGEEPGDWSTPVTAAAVGIFRRAEKRTAPPRVEVGARVKAGDVLGYIEVMKVPQSVTSPGDGTVDGFLVEDGQPVEYGQPLVAISYQLSAIS